MDVLFVKIRKQDNENMVQGIFLGWFA